MHLVPDARGSFWRLLRTPRGRARIRDRLWALLVGLASRLANYRSPFAGPRVTVESLQAGDVRVALSVLYSFFDELELGEPYPAEPKPAYIAALVRQLEHVERVPGQQDADRLLGDQWGDRLAHPSCTRTAAASSGARTRPGCLSRIAFPDRHQPPRPSSRQPVASLDDDATAVCLSVS
jgi:hypothetical protein